MADKDIGGIKFTVDGDDSGLKRVDESMENLQQTAKDTEKAIDKYGNALTDADKKAGRFIDKAGKMREANGRFVKSIELAERKTGNLGDTSVKTAKDIDQLKTEVKENGDQLKTAAGYATAFTAALGTVTAIAAKAGKELNNMARLSGTSVEEFQKLAFGANEAGISTEKLGDIYKDTQDKIGDFLNTGGGELADYFENIAPKVGQTAEQFRGLSGPQALGLFQQGLEKANLTAAEQIFYLESLANDAALLSPLLADNGKGFSDAAKRMEELNLVLSQAEVDGLVEVDKAFNELGTTVAKNTQRIVGENAEEIADAIKSVSEAIASATDFISENMDMIVKITTILGSGAAAWYAYRTAILVATAAQTAFNVAARANPIGILVTVLGTAAGALLTFADNTQTAKEKVDELTGSTQALTYAEKQLLATKLEDRARIKQEELDIMNKQIKVLEAQRAAETDIQKAGRGNDDGALGAMERRAQAAKDEIEALKEKATQLKTIEIISGSIGEKSVQSSKQASDDLQKLIDKYNKLKAEERELLEEQESLNDAFKKGGDNVPLIENALNKVKERLVEIKKELGPLIPDASKSMSIFDVGANTSDDFSDTFVTTLSPKLEKELGIQAKTFGKVFGETLDKLDWSQYGGNIGASLGEALVTGDASMLKGALSGAVGNLATDALTPALTSAFGASASAFLGPLAGGVAGSLVDGIMAGKQEISRSVRIVVADGVAKGFTDIKYDSVFGGSSSVIGFEFLDNERITNSLSNALSELDESIELIGSKVEDFEGVFEGDTIADALDSASEQYINAGFGSIEAFQEFGETASDTLNRITDTLKTTNDAIRNVVGNDTELAIEQYTQGIADAIDTNQELGVEYWQAAKVAITDLATGVLEPVEGAEGDLVRGTESYKRAFDDYLATVAGGGRFFAGGTTKTGQDLINYIDQNQLPEAISRLGEGMQVATIEFAEELESLIEGGNVTNALESLTNVIATDVENYSEQVNNALEDLEDLGFGGVSVSDFGAQYEEALKRTVTPEILANFANAAVLFEKIGDATESLNDELEEQASRVGDLQQEYNALVGRDDLNDLIDYEERLADARSDEEMQLIESIRYQELLNDARKNEVETLSDYVGLLGAAATDALGNLKEGFDAVVEESTASLDALRDSLNDQIDAEQERADKQVERLQAEQDATGTSLSNAKSLINLLDSAMNTLGERSEDLQEKLFTQSFVDIQNAINTARATGELPDAELIEGAVSQLSTAGTGTYSSRVDREREALQARKLLSDLNDLSEDSLTEAEQQIELLDEQIEAIEQSSEATIKALNTQIDDAEEQHKQLIDKFDAQYEAQQEYYDESTAQLQKQLDALNGINNSFESFEQVLSEALNAAGSAVDATVNAGSGSGVTNQDIADYLTQFTNDNFVSDTEAQAIYNKSLEYGVSSSLVGDILNSQLTGGSSINVNDWLSRNNLPSVGGNNMNSMASAVSSMSDRLSAQLSEIAGSSNTTANVLNSSSAPGGFGIVVKQE